MWLPPPPRQRCCSLEVLKDVTAAADGVIFQDTAKVCRWEDAVQNSALRRGALLYAGWNAAMAARPIAAI